MAERFEIRGGERKSELLKELDDILAEQRAIATEIREAIASARTADEASEAVFKNGLAAKLDEAQRRFTECLTRIKEE